MGYLTLMETVTFTVSLATDAFQIAEKFSSQECQRNIQQIRLNTLAVYAVNFYCRCMEVETEFNQNNLWDSRIGMNVADLQIKNVGKLMCIPVLPDAKVCYVPREAWDSRIGYVVVQIDEEACVATLLGFVQQVTTEELPLSQLESLEDLIDCLEPLPLDFVRLSQWFDDIFDSGWQPEHLVFAKVFASRTRSRRDANRLQVNAAKVMRLGIQIPEETVILIVKQRKLSEQEVDICLRLYPGNDSLYLPDGVKLTVLDELNEPIPSLEVQARADNWLQLQFIGAIEDKFSIKVSLAANSVTENFII